MRVTLVVDSLARRLSGIGRYTLELATRLPHQQGIDELAFFSNGRFVEDLSPLLTGQPGVRRQRFPRWLTRRFERRAVARRLRSSLVHGPNYFLPPEAESGIITVHDLSVFRYPETHPPERVRTFEKNFESSLARARHVITDTETVRQEILDKFGIGGDRVTAIPLGVGSDYRPRPAADLQPLLDQWGLKAGGYGLCVSALEPRKRISDLLRAWAALPRLVRDRVPLALAGGEGWLNAGLHDQIEQGAAAGWLKYLGFVPEQDLPALYAGAALFAYPSVYEGFGLPPIEAMASGVPVLVANRSCLPEVCGNAATFADPDDHSGFTRAIEQALTDEQWRALARSRGLERASQLTWEACAERTAVVYADHK